MGKVKSIPFHPFLFALFPPLLLLNGNPLLAGFGDVVLPSSVLLLLAAAAFGVLFLWYRNARKAALFVSFVILFCFGYNNVLTLTVKLGLHMQHRYLLLFYALVLAVMFVLLHRVKGKLQNVTQAANLVALFLVLFNFGGALFAKIKYGAFTTPEPVHAELHATNPPDIYYFILDGYARADILDAVHKFDNTPFLDSLRRRGFYVADSSHSNYPGTLPSVSTLLNFAYRDSTVADKRSFGVQRNAILHNNAFAMFKQQGYDIYTFATGHSFIEIKDNVRRHQGVWNVDDFNKNLLYMTPLLALPLANMVLIPLRKKVLTRPYETLRAVIREPSPKLVHIHSLCPHPPFTFTPDGAMKRPESNNEKFDEGWTPRAGYTDQVQYINKLVLAAVDSILKNSKTPPIIVMHGDHGSPMVTWSSGKPYYSEELSILCAGYFPGKDSVFYKSVTPVNIYPLIFNHYFGTHLPLQPDRSFGFSKDHASFTDATNEIRKEENDRRLHGPPPTPWLDKGK